MRRTARTEAPAAVIDACRDLRPLATLSEVAAFLRAHERTVRRWIAQGRIRQLRSRQTGGSRVLVARAEVARFLESLGAA